MTVLYCVVRAGGPLTIPPGGLPGAEAPRALPLPNGLTAIVASLPGESYAPEIVNDRLRDMDWVSNAALGHEQLIESVMRVAEAVLPMKLLTIFSGDDRLVKDLAKQRKTLERAAASVAGCEEYGLRLVATEGAVAGGADASGPRPSSGTAFLERKKQARDDARSHAERRVIFAREAYETLAAASRDAVNRPVQRDDAERPLLDAAFLVSKDAREPFGIAAEALRSRAAAEHCVFTLTGPWPPYHFVQISHAS